MKMRPRVSVLMPVFNTAAYLPAALRSISDQSFRDFELVAIDDGSTDSSVQILEDFAKGDDRLRFHARENRGVISTRNELLNSARGELVAWMDSDDISLPQRLARQLEGFDRQPDLICLGCAAQCIDPEGNPLNLERYPLTHAEILGQQPLGGAMRFPTTVMRKDVALSVGGFREPFRLGEDFDFLLRLSEKGKMANLSDVLYLYRQHVSSICALLGAQWPSYRDRILALARERELYGADTLQRGGSIPMEPVPSSEASQHKWRVYLSWASHALANRDFALASRYAQAAVQHRPWSLASWRMLARVTRRWIAG